MKKILLFITISFLASYFFFSINVRALTKINFTEAGNGQINTTLHFEEGFVGGIDITFKITGDVKVKEVNFSDKINSGNYNTDYTYDQSSHSLVVRVTTGGTGASHNLLNEKKELALGTIVFETSAGEDVNYKLSETEFKIVGNNWESQTIEQSHITLGDTTEFVYKVNNTETPENPENPEEEGNLPSEGG